MADLLHAHLATTRAIVRPSPAPGQRSEALKPHAERPGPGPDERRRGRPARFGRLNGPPQTAIRH